MKLLRRWRRSGSASVVSRELQERRKRMQQAVMQALEGRQYLMGAPSLSAPDPHEVILNWDTIQEGESVSVYRSDDGGSSYSDIYDNYTTYWADLSVSANTLYYYRLVVHHNDPTYDETTDAANINTPADSGGGDETSLSPPSASAPSDYEVDLNWSATGISSFELDRSTDGSSYSYLWSGDSTSYADTSVQPNTTYYYRLEGGGLIGGYTSITTPHHPSANFSASSNSTDTNTNVTFSFTNQSDPVSSTTFSYSYDFGSGFESGPDSNVYAFADPGTYNVVGRITNADNYSTDYPLTITVSGVSTGPVAAPTHLVATVLSDSAVSLGWTDNSSNETGYELDYANSANFSSDTQIMILGSFTGTVSHEVSGLTPGLTYYFRVRAFDATDNSPYSGTASTSSTTTSAPYSHVTLYGTVVGTSTTTTTHITSEDYTSAGDVSDESSQTETTWSASGSGGTVTETGTTGEKHSRTITATCDADGNWSDVIIDSAETYGNGDLSFSTSGAFSMAGPYGTIYGSQQEIGSNSWAYHYLWEQVLEPDGTWRTIVASGSGMQKDNSDSSWSGSDSQPVTGGTRTISGSGEESSQFELDTTSTMDQNNNWVTTGDGTSEESGDDEALYTEDRTYSRDIDSNLSISGTITDHRSQGHSHLFQAQFHLNADGTYTITGGSGTSHKDSRQDYSYSASGSYNPPDEHQEDQQDTSSGSRGGCSSGCGGCCAWSYDSSHYEYTCTHTFSESCSESGGHGSSSSEDTQWAPDGPGGWQVASDTASDSGYDRASYSFHKRTTTSEDTVCDTSHDSNMSSSGTHQSGGSDYSHEDFEVASHDFHYDRQTTNGSGSGSGSGTSSDSTGYDETYDQDSDCSWFISDGGQTLSQDTSSSQHDTHHKDDGHDYSESWDESYSGGATVSSSLNASGLAHGNRTDTHHTDYHHVEMQDGTVTYEVSDPTDTSTPPCTYSNPFSSTALGYGTVPPGGNPDSPPASPVPQSPRANPLPVMQHATIPPHSASDFLTVSDMYHGFNTVTADSSATKDLYVAQDGDGAWIAFSANFDATDAGSPVCWEITRSDGEFIDSGTFGEGEAAERLIPDEESHEARDFTVRAWADPDGDGVWDTGEETRTVEVHVFKVTADRVYSDQFTGGVANSLPGNAGNSNYILMGTNSSNIAAARADIEITDNRPSTLLFGFAEPLSANWNAVGVPGVPAPNGAGTISLTSKPVSGTTDATAMRIGYGIDVNGDGALESNEVLGWIPYDFKVVSTAARANAIAELNNDITGFWGLGAAVTYPVASNWLWCFLSDLGCDNALNVNGSLSTSDPAYDHHVGAIFTGQTATVNKAVFASSSPVADEIYASTEFTKKVYARIASEAQNITQSIQNSGGAGDFTISTVNDSISFERASGKWTDLFLAIHGAQLPSWTINLHAQLQDGHLVVTPTVTGQLADLYDFNYNDGGLAKTAAMVEAGYAGAGGAGHVFQVVVNLNVIMLQMVF